MWRKRTLANSPEKGKFISQPGCENLLKLCLFSSAPGYGYPSIPSWLVQMINDALARAKDAFNAFRVESVWVRTVFDIDAALYSSGAETEALFKRTAPQFFGDLNFILIEYWVLVVCRITDPAKMGGRENLTVKNLVAELGALGLMTQAIQDEAAGLQAYRDIVNSGRNRVVSHADKETFLEPALLGEHGMADIEKFLHHLQRFNDLVGEALGEGPLDFTGTSGPGDAHDLLKTLRNAA